VWDRRWEPIATSASARGFPIGHVADLQDDTLSTAQFEAVTLSPRAGCYTHT
jgi:hypothetical protein